MENHFMSQEWNKVLKYWSTVIEYIVQETGSASHEVLCSFIYGKFVPDSNNEDISSQDQHQQQQQLVRTQSLNKQRKRNRKYFHLKQSKVRKRKMYLIGKLNHIKTHTKPIFVVYN